MDEGVEVFCCLTIAKGIKRMSTTMGKFYLTCNPGTIELIGRIWPKRGDK